MAAAVPLLGISPLQPSGTGKVQGLLYSAPGAVQGTAVTFTATATINGTLTTVTGTDIVDPSGQAVSPQLSLGGAGQYLLQATLGTLLVAQAAFIAS